jgi:hypothetical protein
MKKFLMALVCIIFFSLGMFINHKPTQSKSEKTFYQIDSIFVEREHYIIDTVKVKVKDIKYVHDTKIEYVEKVFESDDNAEKISMFEMYYPANDSDSLMVITEGQAAKAVSKSIDQERDSTLMEVYKESAQNCDDKLKTIKGKVDTLKVEVKSDADSAKTVGFNNGLKVAGGIAAAIAFVYILLGVK